MCLFIYLHYEGGADEVMIEGRREGRKEREGRSDGWEVGEIVKRIEGKENKKRDYTHTQRSERQGRVWQLWWIEEGALGSGAIRRSDKQGWSLVESNEEGLEGGAWCVGGLFRGRKWCWGGHKEDWGRVVEKVERQERKSRQRDKINSKDVFRGEGR